MRGKWTVNRAHRIVSTTRSDRLRNLRAWDDLTLAGRWVDVASGRVLVRARDFELAGSPPLLFDRTYASGWSHRPSLFGHGWSCSLDLAVWLEAGKLVVRVADGREVELDTFHLPSHAIRRGDTMAAPFDRFTVRCTATMQFDLDVHRGPSLRFERVPGDGVDVARLIAIRSPSGAELRTVHDARARLVAVRDGAGREISLDLDPDGNVEALLFRQPGSVQVSTLARYDHAAGDLVAVHDALGAATRYEYEGHLLVRRVDRSGRSVHYGYDGIGSDARCLRTWGDGGGDDRELAYRSVTGETVVTDGHEHRTTYVHDVVGNVLRVSGVGTFEYDSELRRVRATDAREQSTSYEHDDRGNVVRITSADAATLAIEYDERSCPVRALDATGGEWRWRWDRFGQLVEEQGPLGERRAYEYEQGLLRAVVEGWGQRTELEYDMCLNPSLVRRSGDGETRAAYDWLGRPTAIADPIGGAAALRWDAAGRLVEQHDADGTLHRFDRDPEGRILRATDPAHSVELGYDASGRVCARRGGGESIELALDPDGALLEARSDRVGTWRFVRDDAGRVREERDPAGHRVLYRYGGRAQGVQKISLAGGASIELSRDVRGRVVGARHSDGVREAFSYDAQGRLLEARRGDVVVRWERDAAGRVACEWQGNDWVATRRDPQGRRTEVASSAGAHVSVARSPWGHVDSMASVEDGTVRWRVDFQRATGGTELSRALPGGVTVELDRDAFGRVIGRRTTRGRDTIDVVTYTRDGVGRLCALSDPVWGKLAYELDGLDSPAVVRDGQGWAQQRDTTAPSPPSVAHDERGRAVERTDPDGGSWRYRWTVAGLLAGITRPDGTEVSFDYDALGRRVAMRSPSSGVRWIWDGDVPMHELSTKAAPTTWLFLPESFVPLGKLSAGHAYSAAGDPHEPPIWVYDDVGQPVFNAWIDLLGRAHARLAGTSWPWRWPGFYADEKNGLAYALSRYWSFDLGRYLSPSPAGVAGGLDPYAFAGNPFVDASPFGVAARPGAASGEWLAPGERLPSTLVLARRVSHEVMDAWVGQIADVTVLRPSVSSHALLRVPSDPAPATIVEVRSSERIRMEP